jgi:hypothetical protein
MAILLVNRSERVDACHAATSAASLSASPSTGTASRQTGGMTGCPGADCVHLAFCYPRSWWLPPRWVARLATTSLPKPRRPPTPQPISRNDLYVIPAVGSRAE